MHSQTVTLWNFHKATGKWYPTIIDGVSFWTNDAAAPSAHGGNADNSFSASIPCTAYKSIIARDGTEKVYLMPKTYALCSSPEICFTFSAGKDFVSEGVPPNDDPVMDADYESGYYDAMNDAYDGIHLLTSVMCYGLIPHYEIGGN